MDLETRLRRFEQQLAAFEKLHADELKDFEEKLATYMRLHAGEVKFLREELAEIKKAVEARRSAPVSTDLNASAEPMSHRTATNRPQE